MTEKSRRTSRTRRREPRCGYLCTLQELAELLTAQVERMSDREKREIRRELFRHSGARANRLKSVG